MTLKSPHTFSQWQFHMETPDGTSFVVEEHTLQRLTDKVIKQISQFDLLMPGFSNAARAEADSLQLDWRQYITYAVQHQICIRYDGVRTGLCWAGRGDNIHEFMKEIDRKVEKAPSLIRKAGKLLTKTATLIATGTAQEKLGKCQTCGGRKTFAANKKNLGRVSKLN